MCRLSRYEWRVLIHVAYSSAHVAFSYGYVFINYTYNCVSIVFAVLLSKLYFVLFHFRFWCWTSCFLWTINSNFYDHRTILFKYSFTPSTIPINQARVKYQESIKIKLTGLINLLNPIKLYKINLKLKESNKIKNLFNNLYIEIKCEIARIWRCILP